MQLADVIVSKRIKYICVKVHEAKFEIHWPSLNSTARSLNVIVHIRVAIIQMERLFE